MALQIKAISVGFLAVNCYIVWHDRTREALIMDPGGEADVICAAIDDLALKPLGILLTHAHVDHINAVPEVAGQYDLPVYAHHLAGPLYASPDNCISPWLPAVRGLPPLTSHLPCLDGVAFEVLHTPGHTPGSVCYRFSGDNVLFSGDTLFREAVGRADLPGGNMDTLVVSIREKLFLLPDSTKVFPGHEEPTTIGWEKSNNPFVTP